MTYVDGFVIVVPKGKQKAYASMAREGAKLWKKHGALQYLECVGDDLHPDMGGMKAATFPKMAKAKSGDTIWFSFIIFRSRSHRDRVNAKVMKDPSMAAAMSAWKDKPPFDMKRFAYAGFKAVVEA